MENNELKEISILAEDVYALIKVIDESCKYNEFLHLTNVLKIVKEKHSEMIERLSQLW